MSYVCVFPAPLFPFFVRFQPRQGRVGKFFRRVRIFRYFSKYAWNVLILVVRFDADVLSYVFFCFCKLLSGNLLMFSFIIICMFTRSFRYLQKFDFFFCMMILMKSLLFLFNDWFSRLINFFLEFYYIGYCWNGSLL